VARATILVGLSLAVVASQLVVAQAVTPPPVVVIVLENHSYGPNDVGILGDTTKYIVGNPDAPYINGTLIPQGSLFSNYYATTHPSLPNYLQMVAGVSAGCIKDTTCPKDSVSVDNLFRVLGDAGTSFSSYAQSMPTNCYLSDTDVYPSDHNPEVYFTDLDAAAARPYGCATTDRPFPSSWTDPLPRFSLVVPDRCHGMEGTAALGVCPKATDAIITAGDTWLSQTVPSLVAQGALVLVVFDEATGGDKTNGGGHVFALEVGPNVTAGATDGTAYNHFSLLGGLQDYFGLTPLLGAAAMNRPLPIPGGPSYPAPSIAGFMPASGSTGDTVTITGSGLTTAWRVSFGGIPSGFSVLDDATIAATVPGGAITGPISISTAGGTTTSASDFTVLATPDLSITTADSPDPVPADSNLTYTEAVSDSGDTASGVTVTDAIPSNVIFRSATASQGSCTGTTTVTCNLGTMTAGSTATITIVVTPIAPGTLSNAATVSPTDGTPADNSSTASTTVAAQKKTQYVSVTDSGFSPTTTSGAQGTTVQRNFFGPSANSIVDSTGLGLFASGTITPVNYFRFQYTAAGTYKVVDALSHGATVKIALQVSPSSGSTSMIFTVTWASANPPSGDVFDARVAYCSVTPCSPSYRSWHTGVTTTSGFFGSGDPAWHGAGTYFLQARLRNSASGKASGWSDAKKITVS
jgi:uncharacterized repeat protein (TIGR01451 family)